MKLAALSWSGGGRPTRKLTTRVRKSVKKGPDFWSMVKPSSRSRRREADFSEAGGEEWRNSTSPGISVVLRLISVALCSGACSKKIQIVFTFCLHFLWAMLLPQNAMFHLQFFAYWKFQCYRVPSWMLLSMISCVSRLS